MFYPALTPVIEESEISRLSVPIKANTIIINRANSPELVGSATYVEHDYPNLYLSDKLWQIDFEDYNNEMMALAMQTHFFKEQVRQRRVGASTSMQNLSYQDFLSIKLPLTRSKYLNSNNKFVKMPTLKIISLLNESRQAITQGIISGKK